MSQTNPPHILGHIAATWGIAGFVALLLFALYRLVPISLDAFELNWQWYHWLVFAANTAFMAYSEGYRGFQKGYAPRLVNAADRTQDADILVTYVDRWHWDITMYMLDLRVEVRDPATDYILATSHSTRTSLSRTSPEKMVQEVVDELVRQQNKEK